MWCEDYQGVLFYFRVVVFVVVVKKVSVFC